MNNQTTNPESETVSSKLNCEYSVNIETIRHLMGTIEAVQVNFKSYQRYKGTEFEQIAERDLKDIIAELQHFGVSLALNIL